MNTATAPTEVQREHQKMLARRELRAALDRIAAAVHALPLTVPVEVQP